MKLLLDTHAFLWWTTNSAKLSVAVSNALADLGNEVWLSVASAWEIQLKLTTGKLTLSAPLPLLVNQQQTTNGLRVLPLQLPHVINLAALPLLHRDPFDRLLISQAMTEGATLVTCDTAIAPYPVSTLW